MLWLVLVHQWYVYLKEKVMKYKVILSPLWQDISSIIKVCWALLNKFVFVPLIF